MNFSHTAMPARCVGKRTNNSVIYFLVTNDKMYVRLVLSAYNLEKTQFKQEDRVAVQLSDDFKYLRIFRHDCGYKLTGTKIKNGESTALAFHFGLFALGDDGETAMNIYHEKIGDQRFNFSSQVHTQRKGELIIDVASLFEEEAS